MVVKIAVVAVTVAAAAALHLAKLLRVETL